MGCAHLPVPKRSARIRCHVVDTIRASIFAVFARRELDACRRIRPRIRGGQARKTLFLGKFFGPLWPGPLWPARAVG